MFMIKQLLHFSIRPIHIQRLFGKMSQNHLSYILISQFDCHNQRRYLELLIKHRILSQIFLQNFLKSSLVVEHRTNKYGIEIPLESKLIFISL